MHTYSSSTLFPRYLPSRGRRIILRRRYWEQLALPRLQPSRWPHHERPAAPDSSLGSPSLPSSNPQLRRSSPGSPLEIETTVGCFHAQPPAGGRELEGLCGSSRGERVEPIYSTRSESLSFMRYIPSSGPGVSPLRPEASFLLLLASTSESASSEQG